MLSMRSGHCDSTTESYVQEPLKPLVVDYEKEHSFWHSAKGEEMGYETLLYEVEGETGILTYNRPDKVNADRKSVV